MHMQAHVNGECVHAHIQFSMGYDIFLYVCVYNCMHFGICAHSVCGDMWACMLIMHTYVCVQVNMRVIVCTHTHCIKMCT